MRRTSECLVVLVLVTQLTFSTLLNPVKNKDGRKEVRHTFYILQGLLLLCTKSSKFHSSLAKYGSRYMRGTYTTKYQSIEVLMVLKNNKAT